MSGSVCSVSEHKASLSQRFGEVQTRNPNLSKNDAVSVMYPYCLAHSHARMRTGTHPHTQNTHMRTHTHVHAPAANLGPWSPYASSQARPSPLSTLPMPWTPWARRLPWTHWCVCARVPAAHITLMSILHLLGVARVLRLLGAQGMCRRSRGHRACPGHVQEKQRAQGMSREHRACAGEAHAPLLHAPAAQHLQEPLLCCSRSCMNAQGGRACCA